MELHTKLILAGLLFIMANEIKADERHSNGKGAVLVRIEREGDIAEFHSNKELIDKTFLHPQVKDRNIVVFSIIGAYRQGKSFFLDYCLRYLYANYGSVNTTNIKTISADWLGDRDQPLSGFSWKHGSTAHTKGLMMWSDVFLYDAPDGEKIAIVIVDTQGLFEKGSNPDENAKIFSFSTMISSIQIINIKERIQEDQISQLQTAIELTKLITLKQKGYKKKKAFQNLIFLLRDFEDDEFGFGYGGGEKYLKKFFYDLDDGGEDDDDEDKAPSNSVDQKLPTVKLNRRSIEESFEKIACFLLNHPGNNIRKNSFKGEWGKLDQEFVDNLKTLIESLLASDKLVKKNFLGSEMTGEKFRNIVIALSESYSNVTVPNVISIYQDFINNEMSALVKKEVKFYKEAMNRGLINYDRHDFAKWLDDKHEKYLTNAIDEFSKAEKIDDKESEEKYKKLLEMEILEFFTPFRETKMETYTAFKNEKEMQAIVDAKSQEYRRKINDDVNFKLENFEQAINETHKKLKSFYLNEFVKESENLNDPKRSERFRTKLENEIDKNFDIWKQPTMKRWQELQLKSFSNSELQFYRQSINNESDFNRENFEAYINQKHQEYREKAIRGFGKSTAKNFDHNAVQKNLRILENEIDSTFQALKISKLTDHKNFLNLKNQKTKAELSAIVQSLSYRYENLMNKNLNFSTENFPLTLDQKHEPVKNQILQDFLDQSKEFKGMVVDSYRRELEKTLEAKFPSWKNEKLALYEAHLQRQKEILRKDMTILIQKYIFRYTELMLDNLSFNAKNFEDFIDDKHKNVMQRILSEFLAEAPTSENSFVKELESKLEIIFKDLRQKKIREHKSALEQKQILLDLKVDATIARKLSEYKELIERNIDYDQENFESWLTSKHEKTRQKILEDFSTLPEVTDSSNPNETKEKLRNEIDNAFQYLKPSKIEIQRLNKEKNDKNVNAFLDALVSSQLQSFENDLVVGLNFGTDNFDQKLFEKFYTSKSAALDGFAAAANKPQYLLKKAESSKKLAEEIQKSFDNFKIKASAENLKALQLAKNKKENEITEIADEKFTEFKRKINLKTYSDSDFEKDTFELDLKNDFETLRHKIVADLKSEASEYTDSAFNVRLSNDLNNKIDALFENWKKGILSLKSSFDAREKIENDRKLRKIVDEKLSQYRKEMEGKVKYIFDQQELHAAHTLAKTTAVNSYNTATADFKDLFNVQIFKSTLEREIAETFTKFKIIDIYDARKLRTTGIWIPWEGSRSKFPPNAVIGGFMDEKGCAVARFQGKAGEWCIKRSVADVNSGSSSGKALTSSTFEILLHSKWKYVNYRRADSYTTITNNGEQLCRVYNSNGDKHLGRKDNDSCHFSGKSDSPELRTTGIWIPWEGSRNTFPPNAVISGFSEGGGCAVARYHGKGGQWCVKWNVADINSIGGRGGSALSSAEFEILLHTNWKYVYQHKVDKYSPITNNGEWLCRVHYSNGNRLLGRVAKDNACAYVTLKDQPDADLDGHYILVLGN